MEWIYEGKIFEDWQAAGYEGFIYRITDNTGKMYIGKKAFNHRNKVKLSKKARIGTRKRVEIREKDSGWMSYMGSCKELLAYIEENGTEGFKREIIKLCENKSSLSYWEIHYLVLERVIFSDNYWNKNVGGNWFDGKIHE